MNKVDVRLIIRINSSYDFGEPYLKLMTSVVYFEDCTGYWVTCSKYGPPETLRGYENLGVCAQADKYKAEFYGWDVSYNEVYRARLDDVRLMAATIAKVVRKLQKLAGQLGYAETASDYVIRFAQAVGCTGTRVFGYYDKTSPSQDEHGYVWQDAQGLKRRIEREQQAFAKKYGITEQEDWLRYLNLI